MATEGFDKLTIEELKKKEKQANQVIVVTPIVFLVCFTGLILLNPSLAAATIPLLVPILIGFRMKKGIKEEWRRRGAKQ